MRTLVRTFLFICNNGFPHLRVVMADIYRTRNASKFLILPQAATLSAVPEEILKGLGPAVFFKTCDLADPLLSIDATGFLIELASRGFSVCEV